MEPLFETEKDQKTWEKEWQGMPEFSQADLGAWKAVIVNFASEEDYKAFAKLIGQNLTEHTRSIWFPKAEIGHMVTKRYVDEP